MHQICHLQINISPYISTQSLYGALNHDKVYLHLLCMIYMLFIYQTVVSNVKKNQKHFVMLYRLSCACLPFDIINLKNSKKEIVVSSLFSKSAVGNTMEYGLGNCNITSILIMSIYGRIWEQIFCEIFGQLYFIAGEKVEVCRKVWLSLM